MCILIIYVKVWAYHGVEKKSFDEVYIFAKQLRREDVLLRSGVDQIVTDSPVLLQSFYSDLVGHPTTEGQLQIAMEFEKQYPSFNIVLTREGIPFSPIGRYQKTVDQAIELDNKIEEFLSFNNLSFLKLPSLDKRKLLNVCIDALGRP